MLRSGGCDRSLKRLIGLVGESVYAEACPGRCSGPEPLLCSDVSSLLPRGVRNYAILLLRAQEALYIRCRVRA